MVCATSKASDQPAHIRSLIRAFAGCLSIVIVKLLTKHHLKFLSLQGGCSGLEVLKLISCSTQLSMKFILLIDVKMPTIVGIQTFISMINTTSESLKARNFFSCRYFSFYEQLKFCAQLSTKKFYHPWARLDSA